MKKNHIHLIGICGTAMASLAGMLRERGFRVTGSDAAAYPPMSDFLAGIGIPVAQPFDAKNLQPAPDLVVVGNAISRGNVELEHLLDRRIPFCSMANLNEVVDSCAATNPGFADAGAVDAGIGLNLNVIFKDRRPRLHDFVPVAGVVLGEAEAVGADNDTVL